MNMFNFINHHIFIPVRGSVGRAPNALFCWEGGGGGGKGGYNAVKMALSIICIRVSSLVRISYSLLATSCRKDTANRRIERPVGQLIIQHTHELARSSRSLHGDLDFFNSLETGKTLESFGTEMAIVTSYRGESTEIDIRSLKMNSMKEQR